MRFSGKEELTAKDVMVPLSKLIVLAPDMDALAAIRMLIDNRISGAPVVDEHDLHLGVFSEKTSLRFLHRLNYDALPSNSVAAFMDTDPHRTIPEDTGLLSIMEFFLRTTYRRLPVVKDGLLVGQISRRDVLRSATTSLAPGHEHRLGGPATLYLSAVGRKTVEFIRR